MEANALDVDRELDEALRKRFSKFPDVGATQRAWQRADEIRHEMLNKYGVRELAVELIREVRDSELNTSWMLPSPSNGY